MIRLEKGGKYKLIETQARHRILYLDNQIAFAWIDTTRGDEILVATYKTHQERYTLAEGFYRLYVVENDIEFTNKLHLELSTGNKHWQGYLLPGGLPNKEENKSNILPTKEQIT